VPPFPEPSFDYTYDPAVEVAALRDWRKNKPGRQIPARRSNRLLVATWNVANLGVQKRTDADHTLIAEILRWFDLVALQETNDNVTGLRAVLSKLPKKYRTVFSDAAGNNERMAFVYDATKLTVGDEIGEVAPAPADYRHIRLPGIAQKFNGFDRNPYVATFTAGAFMVSLVNVHLYFGSDSTRSKNRRRLETYAVARWADLRRRSRHAVTTDVVALGDFNLPKAEPGDPVFEALTSRGLHLPAHSTQIASSIATESHYDQVAFFPGETGQEFVTSGVFDFDGAVFADLWQSRIRSRADFEAYVRYHLSDHRPLWAQFRTA
jgi:endonuclease/exonuclease/phosphatase family metal-dependent hydrolase